MAQETTDVTGEANVLEMEDSNQCEASDGDGPEALGEERDILSEYLVQSHCATPKVFGTTHFNESSGRYNVYIGEPAQVEANGAVKIELTDEDLEGHVKLAKKVLFPGSVFLMFTAPRDFGSWCDVLTRNEFNVQLFPFLIIRHEDYIQAKRSRKPQNISDFIVVSYSPGINKENFIADISTEYQADVSTFRRRWAVMNRVRVTDLGSRLMRADTRLPIRPTQRSANAIAELLNTFCPPRGNVLDVRAGAMETGVACMLTNRA